MKTIFFILIPLIIFGTAIYVYLRQEQNKYIPKDKYDEAMDDIYRKRRAKGKNFAELVGTTGLSKSLLAFNSSYFFILIITFFIATLISILPVSVAFPLFIVILVGCVIFFPFLPLLFVLFPAGLMYITQTDSNYFLSIIFGWLIYFFIIMLGTLAKNRSVFLIIYFIFAAILVLNIVGCAQAASTICSNGCPL